MHGLPGLAVMQEPHVVYVHTVQLGPNTLFCQAFVPETVHSYFISSVLFLKLWIDWGAEPEFAPNSYLLRIYFFLLGLVLLFWNSHLENYVFNKPLEPEVRIISKDDFNWKTLFAPLCFIFHWTIVHCCSCSSYLRTFNHVRMEMDVS